jgi:molybdate transport system regulatory protein
VAAPVVRFRIDFADFSSVGPGKISLLEAIRDAGSLLQGARNIGMSYRRAWLLVASLKAIFPGARDGSKQGRQGRRWDAGHRIWRRLDKNYRELERDFETLAERRLHPIIAAVIRHSKSGAKYPCARSLSKKQMV